MKIKCSACGSYKPHNYMVALADRNICEYCDEIRCLWLLKGIEHFSIFESWGDFKRIDIRLIWLLDKIREKIGLPIIIHCGYATSGHSENSYHYKGQAVDFHIEGIAFEEACEVLDRLWWFGGLGVYPEWNRPGFHLDIGPHRRWQQREGKYLALVA